jgi:hypothetical protein
MPLPVFANTLYAIATPSLLKQHETSSIKRIVLPTKAHRYEQYHYKEILLNFTVFIHLLKGKLSNVFTKQSFI